MKTFNYTIRDPLGIHARPAGLLAKIAKTFESNITIEKDGRSVSADRLLSVMGLGIRCGDTVKITVTGGDEETILKELQTFFEENL